MARPSEPQGHSINHEGCGKEIAREVGGVLYVEDLRRRCRTWVPIPGWFKSGQVTELLGGLVDGRLNVHQILAFFGVEILGSELLDQVRAFGGRYEQARLTVVPEGETLDSQVRGGLMKFKHDRGLVEASVSQQHDSRHRGASIGTEVIYFPKGYNLPKTSPYRFRQDNKGPSEAVEEDRERIQKVLKSLPQIEGISWVIPSASILCRVLRNHYDSTREYLLVDIMVLTTDLYKLGQYPFSVPIIVGKFGPEGSRLEDLGVNQLRDGSVHLFPIGISTSLKDKANELHLSQWLYDSWD